MMKYLKYILGIIALLAILFVVRGLISPSITYTSEVTVDKSIEESWAVMNDESKLSEWLQGITNIEHVSGEKNTVGAVTSYTFDENGQESTVVETIKAIRDNEHVAMSFAIEGVMNMEYEVDFAEKDGKTHIKSSTVTKGDGWFMRSLVPFIKGSMQTQEDQNMANLQKLINENKTDYFPVVVEESID